MALVKRTKWSESMVADAILESFKSTGRFPSAPYLRETGQNGLSCAIVRTGGFVKWAKRLGIDREKSDSDVGWDGERQVQELLTGRGFVVEKQAGVTWPFDLLVNKSLRVDVKSAKFATYGPCSGWFYRIGKAPQADLIALMQTDAGSVYFIPWPLVPFSNITISKSGGKWASFMNRFDIVDEMVKSRTAEFQKYKL